MLYIRTTTGEAATYYASENFKKFISANIAKGIGSSNIDFLTADGHELEKITVWINTHRIKIPVVPGSCVWTGDFAKFIYNNLY